MLLFFSHLVCLIFFYWLVLSGLNASLLISSLFLVSCRFPSRLASSWVILSNLFPWFVLKSILVLSHLYSYLVLTLLLILCYYVSFLSHLNQSYFVSTLLLTLNLISVSLVSSWCLSSHLVLNCLILSGVFHLITVSLFLSHIDVSLLI